MNPLAESPCFVPEPHQRPHLLHAARWCTQHRQIRPRCRPPWPEGWLVAARLWPQAHGRREIDCPSLDGPLPPERLWAGHAARGGCSHSRHRHRAGARQSACNVQRVFKGGFADADEQSESFRRPQGCSRMATAGAPCPCMDVHGHLFMHVHDHACRLAWLREHAFPHLHGRAHALSCIECTLARHWVLRGVSGSAPHVRRTALSPLLRFALSLTSTASCRTPSSWSSELASWSCSWTT
eukprot:360794-Chlamydomonas_euryale.AAC.2